MDPSQQKMSHSCNAFSSAAAIFIVGAKINSSAFVRLLQKIEADIWCFFEYAHLYL